MDLKETIELLSSLQNPMEDYADMVGAPAWVYGMRYVFPEPEDYAIEEAIEVLKKAEKYRWHDLRDNPDDLPRQYGKTRFSVDVLIATETDKCFSAIGYIDLVNRVWRSGTYGYERSGVIAWKYIEPFEKSVSEEESEE